MNAQVLFNLLSQLFQRYIYTSVYKYYEGVCVSTNQNIQRSYKPMIIQYSFYLLPLSFWVHLIQLPGKTLVFYFDNNKI